MRFEILHKPKFLVGAGLLVLAAVLFLPTTDSRQDSDTYILATATTGGTFYPVGVAIATLTKQTLEPEHGVALAAISSAGSEENLRLMRSGEAAFAILQGLYGAWAWRGEGRLSGQEPFQELRSVTALWPNVEHFLIRESLVETGTVADLHHLAGRRFSIGARYSGTEGSNRHILHALGIDPDHDMQPVYQGYGASADAFQNQLIDGMNTPAGVPVGAVTRAMAAARGNALLLSFDEGQRNAINQGLPGALAVFRYRGRNLSPPGRSGAHRGPGQPAGSHRQRARRACLPAPGRALRSPGISARLPCRHPGHAAGIGAGWTAGAAASGSGPLLFRKGAGHSRSPDPA
jgi:TRAP transporter TAXI family solute receptor